MIRSNYVLALTVLVAAATMTSAAAKYHVVITNLLGTEVDKFDLTVHCLTAGDDKGEQIVQDLQSVDLEVNVENGTYDCLLSSSGADRVGSFVLYNAEKAALCSDNYCQWLVEADGISLLVHDDDFMLQYQWP